MNYAHLKTLLAIRNSGSLNGAAAIVHLSHSAISVQMKQLETDIGAPLFIKGKRPATLTPLGEEVAKEAQIIVARMDHLKGLSHYDDKTGQVRIGFVPTTLQTLLPVALNRLRNSFPELQVSARSGLSAKLAQDVEAGELDFAILSAPAASQAKVQLHEIGVEKLFLVTSKSNTKVRNLEQAMQVNPYIAFNRNTWLGGRINEFLGQSGLGKDPAIELDSIDAIENLVKHDFGISVVPQRILAPPLGNTLRCIPMGAHAPVRRLMLASTAQCRRESIRATLENITLS